MIIGLAGLKQSGKSTTCNILHGIVLKERGMISEYSIGKQGELLIKTPDLTEWSVFDINRKDEEFVAFAEKEMWPYVKSYSFADPLKTIATELFNIPHKNVYGTNKDKNQKIKHLLWENMPGVITPEYIKHEMHDSLMGMTLHDTGVMTAREFLQFFGTDIMRKKHGEDVWIRYVDAWIKVHQYHNKKVENNKDTIFIIPDIRFENEAEFIRTSGGKVIKIEANDRVQEKVVQENLGLEEQQHVSETNIDNIKADYVVNNSKLQQPFVFQKVTSILNDITF